MSHAQHSVTPKIDILLHKYTTAVQKTVQKVEEKRSGFWQRKGRSDMEKPSVFDTVLGLVHTSEMGRDKHKLLKRLRIS